MRPMKSSLCWAVLGLLLVATLVGAATLDRRSWPAVVGDEATYLMQAQSLAWDFDLRYTKGDLDRFVAQWGVQPEGLILQSGEGGTLVYGKPSSYPLFIAPFLRLSPTRGAAIANVLLLALAAVATARTLQRRIGPAAPLWVAAWIFASVAFVYIFWVHSDLFLMCLVALAFALAYGQPESEAKWRGWLRWLAVGGLLALVLLARPLYGTLLLPAALAVPPSRRRAGLAALALGAAGLVLLSAAVNLASRGHWTSYAGDRQSFYSYTGFPASDLRPPEWEKQVAEHGSNSWIEGATAQVDLLSRQTAWNVLYFLIGRHVGVLPYYLPILLGFTALRRGEEQRRGEGRWALVLAALLSAAVFLAIRPFNFWGGGGAIANRYFLPLYPAFWFIAGRPARAVWAVVLAALAAPILWPLWTAPRAFPIDEEGGYRHVSSVAHRVLPYETTLSHLKPSGQEDILHNDLWVKILTPSIRAEENGTRLHLLPGRDGEVLIGSEQPLTGVRLRFAPSPETRMRVLGPEVSQVLRRPDGGTTLLLRFRHSRAHHRMWWGRQDIYLYELGLAPPSSSSGVQQPEDGLIFQILREPAPAQAGS
jgi:hypothetical protein